MQQQSTEGGGGTARRACMYHKEDESIAQEDRAALGQEANTGELLAPRKSATRYKEIEKKVENNMEEERGAA